MDAEFLKYLASMGTGGTLAGVIFYFYLKTVERHASDLKGIIDGQHRREDMLFTVVKENTASNTELISAIRGGRHAPGHRSA